MKTFTQSIRGLLTALVLMAPLAGQGAEMIALSYEELNHVQDGRFVYEVPGVGTFTISGAAALSYGSEKSWGKTYYYMYIPTGTYSLTATSSVPGKGIRIVSGSMVGGSTGIGSTLEFGNGSSWFLVGSSSSTSTGDLNTFDPVYIGVITNKVRIKTFNLQYEVVDYAEDYTLSDAAGHGSADVTYCRRLTLQRAFKAGWNTVCLPFDLDPAALGSGTVAQEFVSYNAEQGISFAAVTTMQANRPYLVYCPAAVPSGLVLTEVQLVAGGPGSVTVDGLTFCGNYTPALSMEGRYGVARVDDKARIRRGSATAWMNGLRAYFELAPDAELKSDVLCFEGFDATSLSSVCASQPAAAAVYGLDGTCVRRSGSAPAALRRGIYVVNGRKVGVR